MFINIILNIRMNLHLLFLFYLEEEIRKEFQLENFKKILFLKQH